MIMRFRKLLNITVILGSAMFSGCTSISTMQTAETLEPGEVEMAFAVGNYVHTDFIKYPMLEAQVRFGLVDKLDAGIKLTTGGSTVVDVKYNLIDTGKFAMAIGLGFGKLKLEAESGNTTKDLEITDILFPLYLSYNFSDSFAVYLSPKVIDRESSYPDGITTDETFKGGTFGFKLGDKSGVYLEYSRFEEDTSGLELKQTTIAFFFRN